MLFSYKCNPIFICTLLFCFAAKAQSNYTLRQALHTARANNPFLKSEQLNISIAETDIVTAKLRPNLNLSNESIQLLQPSEFALNSPWYNNQNRQVLWQLNKPFQVAGQRKNKIEVAYKNLVFAEKEYMDTERHLFTEVAEKWLEVWTIRKQLDVLTTAKENINSLLLNDQHRYRNQVITQTDLYRTELLSKQYTIQYQTILQEFNNLKKELAFLMGVRDSIDIDMADGLHIGINTDVDSLVGYALESRSDILATQQSIAVSSSNIKLQKSLAYPKPELGFLWNPQNSIPYFGFSFTLDLPFFDRNQGEIRKSYLLKSQTERQLFAIENQLYTEVRTAYDSYHLHRQNIIGFESILEQSQTILDNVKYAYLQGGTTIIDFLEAQRSWLETQQYYYDALQQYRQSHIQLLSATGLINQIAQ